MDDPVLLLNCFFPNCFPNCWLPFIANKVLKLSCDRFKFKIIIIRITKYNLYCISDQDDDCKIGDDQTKNLGFIK